MLHPTSQLSDSIFDPVINKRPTRDGYGEGLVALGHANPRIVALSADLTESTRTLPFAQAFPERFIQVGVAEQHMVTLAAGLAAAGKIPFIASYATFSPGRNWEQIRTTVAYNNANVKIAGHHAGISVGSDGATHQAIEDIATMRVIPHMQVIVPADAIEARKATIAAGHFVGPVYLRFGREKTPVFTTEQTPFVPGRAEILWQGKKPQVAIIGCGPLLYNALCAAKELRSLKIEVMVINMHTIKPLDEKAVVAAAKKCGAVVTVEEHQVLGGLGGAVAEVLARKAPTPMEFIGMQDVFGGSGKPSELIEEYGMGISAIVAAVKKAYDRRLVIRG
jgi:transketolase